MKVNFIRSYEIVSDLPLGHVNRRALVSILSFLSSFRPFILRFKLACANLRIFLLFLSLEVSYNWGDLCLSIRPFIHPSILGNTLIQAQTFITNSQRSLLPHYLTNTYASPASSRRMDGNSSPSTRHRLHLVLRA